MQHIARPSTLDNLGLAAWAPGQPTPAATLGSLTGLLGDFVAAPSAARFIVPAQRTASRLEARR